MMECPICSNSKGNSEFSAKEMMFGMRDSFQYVECGNCGCLWIKKIPENIADYYPNNYYSFSNKNNSLIEKWLKKQTALIRLNGSDTLLRKLMAPFTYPNYLSWLNGYCKIDTNSRVLDIGSGSGSLLLTMRDLGFKNLTGIDPFIESDIQYSKELNVYKKSVEEVDEEYDFIMLHHSFEHMHNPKDILKKIKSILSSNGSILIRIPLADSYSYETYGSNWVELDPPRHFFLHTKKSIELLAKEQSLEIDNIYYDSSIFEIIESEKWKRDIPSKTDKNLFSKKEKKEISKLVRELNKKEQASRACFYISHL